MSRTWRKLTGACAAVLVLLPAQLWGAAGGGGEALVFVADTRGSSGWQAWWGNLYNESLFYFAVATVLLIPTAGAILGLLADFFMVRVGINLRSRTLAEH